MPRKISQQTKLGLALSAGVAVVSSVIGGTLLGYWLDERFGTKPWLLLVGVIIGTFGGFTWLYRLTSQLK